MASVQKSLIISLGGRYLLIAIQLASYFILARLLTPEDIGLFAVASAAITIAHVVREFGVGSYLIQEKELSEAKIATAFTITVSFGLFLFLILFSLAPYIASFYQDERLTDVLRLLSFSFLLLPLNSTASALLRRDMAFGAIFWVNVAGNIAGFIVAVILSYLNYGYFSLVWSSLATSVTAALVVSFFQKGGMFHRLTFCEWKSVYTYGSQMTLIGVIGTIAENASDLVIGRLLGFTTTAIVSRAQGIMNLFYRDISDSIRTVAFPAFAQLHREEKEIEPAYIRSVTIMLIFAWPFYGFFSLFSLEALRLFFGPQWDAATPLVPWFCLAGAIGAFRTLIPVLMQAIGGIRYMVRFHLFIDPLRVITFILVIYFYRTTEAFAIAYVLFMVFSTFLLYVFKNRLQKTQFIPLMRGVFKSIFVTLCSLLIPAVFSLIQYLDVNEPFVIFMHQSFSWLFIANSMSINEWGLIPIGFLMIPCWVIAVLICRHPLADESMFKKIVFYNIAGKHS